MLMEDGIAGRPVASAPRLVAQTVDKRTILEMEIALTKACEVLPRELDSHKNRCFVAKKILKRVNAGERTFGGMVSAGMAAVEALRRKQEQV
ncbi:hypothetical protein [Tardiphaga robiniae]|uniref:hypothetical protein n=1 Tax=Tardiphaga robiniae TaxID=943830 RepID=UPI001112AB91|nr:hypothetical protein [Tardiphaga robiniae]